MVIQGKIFSFKIKRQAKNVLPGDVERTVVVVVKKLFEPQREKRTVWRVGAAKTRVHHENMPI